MPDLITDGASFVLDDRTTERMFDQLKAYCEKISFGKNNNNWADVLFGEKSREQPYWVALQARLKRLLEQPELGDGKLAETQAFVLAVLKLLETPRTLSNQLPARYQDLYYRDLLGMVERPANPDRVVLNFALDDTCAALKLPAGMLFNAGQDSQGTALRYQLDQALVANQAKLTDLRWCRPQTELDGNTSDRFERRVIFDALAGQEWPKGGVRLFEPAPAKEEDRLDRDRPVINGRIIGSPVLAAAIKEHNWTITIKFSAGVTHLTAQISIDNKWTPLRADKTAEAQTWTLQLAGQNAGTSTVAVDLDELASSIPLLRLTNEYGQAVPRVSTITLNVGSASGVRIVTDEGIVATNQSCYPFGSTPRKGSGVNLVVANWWNLANQLTEIKVTPTWLDLPTQKLADWYKDYKSFVFKDQFKIIPWVIKSDGTRTKINESKVFLFEDKENGPIGQPLAISINDIPVASVIPLDSDNRADWPWSLRLELDQSFLHDEYAKHLAEPPVFQEETVTDKGGNALTYPDKKTPITKIVIQPRETYNPPYTPYWKSVQVEYTATDESVSEQKVLTPFGYVRQEEVVPIEGLAQVEEASQENVSSNDKAKIKAELYLGVNDVQSDQLLSLHWQVRSPQPHGIRWEYLAKDEKWQSADKYINDGTAGLSKSGVWLMTWPTDALDTAHSMPTGRYWLRALIDVPKEENEKNKKGPKIPVFPLLLGIHTNVGWATLIQAEEIDSSHFAQPLPAGSVTQAFEPPDGLYVVSQPWPSEGGKAAESGIEFAERVAKRLRHRERALNGWDLATLLKDGYTGLCEVKIAGAIRRSPQENQSVQQLVVMPSLAIMDNEDSRCPVLSKTHLTEMTDWLKKRASPWLHLECCNPAYKFITVECAIEFKAGISEAYGKQRLWHLLEQRYLPWKRGRSDEWVIGKALDYYEIRAFIQGRDEVKAIQKFTLDEKESACSAQPNEVLVLELKQ